MKTVLSLIPQKELAEDLNVKQPAISYKLAHMSFTYMEIKTILRHHPELAELLMKELTR